jgi:hypothetical protein
VSGHGVACGGVRAATESRCHDAVNPSASPRLHSEAAERNREPIRSVLARHLAADAEGTVLELASGSGQHVAHFAPHWPRLTWQPSDPDPQCRASITAWCADDPRLARVRPPLALDVLMHPWPVEPGLRAVLAINLIHIAPWPVTAALIDGAAQCLAPHGLLCLYGPYTVGGRHTAPSNAAFDASLRARNAAWGVRDRDQVLALAGAAGFTLLEQAAMPANNQTLVLKLATGD